MLGAAIAFGSGFLWRAFGELSATIATGKPAFNHVFGTSFFEYLAAHPEDAAIFNAAMTSISSVELPLIVAAYDFSGFERIVDVGGGQGALLHGILSANPKLRGVLFDLPSVVASAGSCSRFDRWALRDCRRRLFSSNSRGGRRVSYEGRHP